MRKQSHSAADSALGYLYQVRCSLYLILSQPDDVQVNIEGLDDVTFENHREPIQLLQLKHNLRRRTSLNNTCLELWKTIGIWSDYILDKKGELPILTLLTVGKAPHGSAASCLRREKRNENKAFDILLATCQKSRNKKLLPSMESFQLLTDDQKKRLIGKIVILDASPNIVDIVALIKDKVKYSVRPEHLNPMYERLEGWWFNKAISILAGNAGEPVTRLSIHYKISEVSDQFKPDALPIDFLEAEPPDHPDPSTDKRLFVRQLQEIALNPKRIENAIRDYYKAFLQRSRWARDELLIDDELSRYENRLVEEWQRYALACQDDCDINSTTEENLRALGRQLYTWMELTANLPIRPSCTNEYVMRGSYHILADKKPPAVWWHPKFLDRIEKILTELVGECYSGKNGQ